MTPIVMDLKNGVNDGERWFYWYKQLPATPVIVSNKNWNIPIKW